MVNKMADNIICNITTQQIQIFLKAVEMKNFSQVANYFNFTPSMISKTISALEEEMNLVLFIRKPHNLSPTPAAEYLAKEWRQIIASINYSIERAQLIKEDKKSRIIFGFVDSSNRIDQMIMDAIREYTGICPNISITIEKHDMHRAAELLCNGLLDIIITSEMESSYLNEHHVSWEHLIETDVVVYVPSGNPLFEKKAITFDDLKEQTFLSLNPQMHPSYHTWLMKTCRNHGFEPEIAATYRTVRSLMFSLNLYDHLFIGDSITSDWCTENLKMFHLNEKSFSLIAWRNTYDDESILKFKDFIKQIYDTCF